MVYSHKTILEKWFDRLDRIKEGETFNLYIDNPFCISRCSYCKYRGFLVRENKAAYRRYYSDFLPNHIRKFSSLIEKRKPDSAYFGGGTANLMTAEMMKKIFELIPGFSSIKNKVFEGEPSLMNNRKIELIKENEFSYVSLGIQSFDEKLLKENKRKGYKGVPIKEYIKDIQSAGTKVNCDLMAFLGKGSPAEDMKRLECDFRKLFEEYSPDIITTYPKTSFLQREMGDRGEDLAIKLRKMLLRLAREYGLNPFGALEFGKEEIGKHYYYDLKVTKINRDEIGKVMLYKSTSPPHQAKWQNTLSLGGFKDHMPYSYFGREFAYWNVNTNWRMRYSDRPGSAALFSEEKCKTCE